MDKVVFILDIWLWSWDLWVLDESTEMTSKVYRVRGMNVAKCQG